MPCQLHKQRGTVTMFGNCSLNYLQQLLSNIPHLGLQHTPVASLHTSETPHMEHAGRSWLYMNTMQIFFPHFINRHANERAAELQSSGEHK